MRPGCWRTTPRWRGGARRPANSSIRHAQRTEGIMRVIARSSLRIWTVAATLVLLALLAPAQIARAQAPRLITLAEALTLAAQNNYTLRVAAFEATVARAQLAQAEAVKRGTLTLSATYTRINERPATSIVIPPGTIPGITDPVIITLPPPGSPARPWRGPRSGPISRRSSAGRWTAGRNWPNSGRASPRLRRPSTLPARAPGHPWRCRPGRPMGTRPRALAS